MSPRPYSLIGEGDKGAVKRSTGATKGACFCRNPSVKNGHFAPDYGIVRISMAFLLLTDGNFDAAILFVIITLCDVDNTVYIARLFSGVCSLVHIDSLR